MMVVVTVLLSLVAVAISALTILLTCATGRTLRREPETRTDRIVRRIVRV